MVPTRPAATALSGGCVIMSLWPIILRKFSYPYSVGVALFTKAERRHECSVDLEVGFEKGIL